MVLCAACALVGCGGSTENDIGVPVPDGARENAVRVVSDSLNMQARAEDVLGPRGVHCSATAHVEGRPQGKQYDYQCHATFHNGGVIDCVVPAGSNGGIGCSQPVVNDAPFPGIYQRK